MPEPRPATTPEEPLEARPSAARGDEVPLLSNAELARIFHQIGDLVELKGELIFKAQAYHRAADAISDSPVEVARAYRESHAPRLPGVGRAIDEKLAELADTSRLRFHDRLRREGPPSRLDLLAVPGLGPRTVRALHETLGVTSPAELGAAVRAGRLRGGRGVGPEAEEEGEDSGGFLAARRGPRARRPLPPAVSFRRRRETVGDLDLLADTDDPAAGVARFTALPSVARGLNRGVHKAAVELERGPQADLMVMPEGAAGSYLVHFTGSAAHNVRLRGMARERGGGPAGHGLPG